MDTRTLTVCIDRYQYLTVLDRTELAKRELIESLDKPRSTVDRDIRLLESESVVERTTNGCKLTVFGQLVLKMLSDLFPVFSDACRAREVVNRLPPETTFPPELLVNAEIITAEPSAPDKPALMIRRRIENATGIRSMAPFILDTYVEQLQTVVAESSSPVELLLTSTAIDRLLASHRSTFETELENDKLTLIEVAEIPFGLFLIEQRSATEILLVTLSDRSVVDVIAAQSDLAKEWGERIYNEYRAIGEPLLHG